MAITAEDIDRILNVPKENERLEFKEAKNQFDPAKLFKYCVAIANEGGGQLILGVTDAPPRRVVGSNCFSDTQDIASRIFNKLRIRVDVDEVNHPNGRVLVFNIPSSGASLTPVSLC